MYQVSDAIGNSFFTDSKALASKIVSEKDNPFIRMGRVSRRVKVAKEHIVKSYADFYVYFY